MHPATLTLPVATLAGAVLLSLNLEWKELQDHGL
jgi:hypothetical protein